VWLPLIRWLKPTAIESMFTETFPLMAMLMDLCSINYCSSSLMALFQLPLASANGLWILLIFWASALLFSEE
jgi:hypothetical protein